jgi:glycine cleavage system aminomethyltransferase T
MNEKPYLAKRLPEIDFEIKLTAYELSVPVHVDRLGLSPETARELLTEIGYTDDLWDEILAERGKSHELRACIIIARGNLKRLPDTVRENLRLQDYESYIQYEL